MGKGIELDEIVGRVRDDDEMIGRLQTDGGPKVGETEGDGFAVIDIAWISEEPNPRITLVLNRRPIFIHHHQYECEYEYEYEYDGFALCFQSCLE